MGSSREHQNLSQNAHSKENMMIRSWMGCAPEHQNLSQNAHAKKMVIGTWDRSAEHQKPKSEGPVWASVSLAAAPEHQNPKSEGP